DGDGGSTPSTLAQRVYVQLQNESKQFSEELRLQGEAGAVNWVAGLFYYQDEKKNTNILNIRTDTGATAARIPSNARIDTKSGAIFGQADWKFADRLTLSAGARYTIENRELVEARLGPVGSGPVVDVRAAVADPDPVTKDVTGRVSLTWEATSDN